jgi:hypothetical protein
MGEHERVPATHRSATGDFGEGDCLATVVSDREISHKIEIVTVYSESVVLAYTDWLYAFDSSPQYILLLFPLTCDSTFDPAWNHRAFAAYRYTPICTNKIVLRRFNSLLYIRS